MIQPNIDFRHVNVSSRREDSPAPCILGKAVPPGYRSWFIRLNRYGPNATSSSLSASGIFAMPRGHGVEPP
jgi:hypothetical protein